MPFDDVGAGPTTGLERAWTKTLAHRLRVLLHTLPLDALHRSDALRDYELRHYDGLALGLATIDLIVDHMGLDTDVDRVRVAQHVAPLLAEMDRLSGYEPDGERTFLLKFDSNFSYRAEPVPAGVLSARDLREGMRAMAHAQLR